METVPSTNLEINMPDVLDKEEMGAFVDSLSPHIQRRGVKQLRSHAQQVYTALCRIDNARNHMQRILHVVNGEATHAQQQFYTERKIRTAAQRFYTTLSDMSIVAHCNANGIDYKYLTRQAMEQRLIDAHVQREIDAAWGVAAQRGEESGYMGVAESERVMRHGTVDKG